MSNEGKEIPANTEPVDVSSGLNADQALAQVSEGFEQLKSKIAARAEALSASFKQGTLSTSGDIPSELLEERKMEAFAEDMLLSIGGGALVGGLASALIFRGKSPRLVTTAFAAGIGAGSSWTRQQSVVPVVAVVPPKK
mmetsp:Transcript_1216/g.1928  ORF Transcript_1216/g.1928 Transcript_1216/m.1928 type:complete len:139 (+) Transcript_1216:85-501(+)|eukprot:CAMPEP_0184523060 /NCGR_PEP_ID=MMETSP0198_2-20121128/8658_1 /TAXON_ID=1112570 /ORGANISM="Thraustochytrium sp., Strain LLF1b" /LENGTH=138 /DNA_ID=CAMNT_0026914017 /DNA_START=68 /DNA_END=484 /DNA_ORIENTATION=+